MPAVTGIFISYRQADSKAWAIALRDALAGVFGEQHVFLDKETLSAGNWREQIQRALERCTVVLVVIGPRWLSIADDQGRPRIQIPDDSHRNEIAFALSRRGITVIPVLVDEAGMPQKENLPPDIHALCEQQARKFGDTHARRRADLSVLVEDIESVSGPQGRLHNGFASGSAASRATRNGARSTAGSAMMTVGTAFGCTLAASVFAYLMDLPFSGAELFFVLLVFLVLTSLVRRVWGWWKDQRV
jgi:ABC-type glycerol-3-phosphate transport system permease component